MKKDASRTEEELAAQVASLLRRVSELEECQARATRSEERTARLRRLNSLFAATMKTLVPIRQKVAASGEACRLAVEKGSFRLAWIAAGKGGSLDSGARFVVAWGREGGKPAQVRIPVVEHPEAREPIEAVIRDGRAFISNDLAQDRRVLGWRDHATMYGCRSAAVFPLSVLGRVAGLFGVGSAEEGFFGEEEVELLEGAASGISLLFESVEKAETQGRTEEERQLALERWRGIFDSSLDAVRYTNLDGMLLDMNEGYERLTGYSRSELLSGRTYQDLTPVEYHEHETNIVDGVISTGEPAQYEKEYVRKDGCRVPVLLSVFLVKGPSGGPIGLGGIIKDITERKRAEQALQLRSAMMANLAEGVLLVRNKDAVIVYTNPRLEEMFGYGEGELVGKHVSVLNAPTEKSPEEIASEICLCLREARRWEGEICNRRKDGTRFWCQASASNFEDPDHGEVWVSVHADITERRHVEDELRKAHDELEQRVRERTEELARANEDLRTEIAERKQVEERLKEREEQLRGFFHASPAGLGILDSDLRYVRINEPLARINGFPAEDHIGKTAREMVPKIAPLVEPLYRGVLTSGVSVLSHELRGETPREPGVTRHWVVSYFPILGKGGKPNALGLVVLEITERKKAEERLRESEERFRAAFDFAAIGMSLASPEGRFLRVNREFSDMLGYAEEELVGRTYGSITHPDDLAASAANIERLLRGQISSFQMEKRYIHKSERVVWVHLSVSLIRDAKGEPLNLIAQLQDITARKQSFEQIERLNRELEMRVRELDGANSELESFSFSVSHDLRAPLRTVAGFSEALLEEYGRTLDDRGRDYAKRIRAGAQRMEALIDDLLNLSRVVRSEIHSSTVDLSTLAQSIARELRKTERDRRLEMIVEPGLTTEGDARLLRIALENLIGNAWKFTAKRPQARVEFGADGETGRRTFFVRDNGVGFDMRHAHKLFFPFQRLHGPDEFPGTGIGLATVQRIIRRHGGEIWAQGEEGKGATFSFTLGENLVAE